jgi:hypothetical protein
MARNTIWQWFPMPHQAPLPPRWTNLLFICLMCLSTMHAHRMGTWNVPIRPLLTEIWGGTVVGFWVVLRLEDIGHGISWAEARWKNIPQSWQLPSPYGRHGALPRAPPHTTISQHAGQQVYVIKTREYYCFYYVFISYIKAQCIVNTPCLSVCGLRQQAALRVSYSQQAALRVWCSQHVLKASYYQRRCWECWEHHTLSGARWEYDTLRAVCLVVLLHIQWRQQKNSNRQYWRLPINDFGQQRLNSGADWSAAGDGQVLPHFEHIVSGTLTPPCPMAAVF